VSALLTFSLFITLAEASGHWSIVNVASAIQAAALPLASLSASMIFLQSAFIPNTPTRANMPSV
jgi:hypothetical protein